MKSTSGPVWSRDNLTGRREFLRTTLTAGSYASIALGARARAWQYDILRVIGEDAASESTATPITSNIDFFIRNHFRASNIQEDRWDLEVVGLVSKPRKLSYSEFLLAPSVRRTVTMECAGNPSGGRAVSTAVWTGIPLSDLLRTADVQSAATTVVFHGADSGDSDEVPAGTHFARAIPLDKAMDGTTLLAYEMNGVPLSPDHGFPLRALVAGWYGMDSVKWLIRVEVLKEPFGGYFQEKYYAAVKEDGQRRVLTSMNINSKFLRPSNDEDIRGRTYRLEGVAWGGERRVRQVEVRCDSTGTWEPAVLGPSSEPMVWRTWNFNWQIPRSGRHTLEVRATDEDGNRQPVARDPKRKDPYELNTPHQVDVNVLS